MNHRTTRTTLPTRAARFLPVACIALASVVSGCSKKLTAGAIDESPAAIVQKGDHGTSTWVVGSDGTVNAALKGPDGKPIAEPVAGQVTFAAPNAPPVAVPVQYDPKSGVLTAAGPKLDADITPMSYALTVDGKPWNGSLAVPRGGTLDLVDTGKLQANVSPGTVGPNGGLVQAVGPDRVELVANKSTGDVRAYVLDPENKPIDPGDRKITVALQGESPEVLVLEPEPQAHFVFGHLRSRMDPTHVTVAVNARGTTHACLVGWSPGAVVVVGPQAPRVHLLAVDAWPGEVVELHGKHGRHHGDFVVGGPGVEVEGPGIVVGAPSVVVGGPGVVVGGPNVVVGGPNVVVGGPGAIVGGPGVVVGGGVRGHEEEHGRDHDRGGGHHGH